MPREEDEMRIRHMLQAAQHARDFSKDRTRADRSDLMFSLALVKALETIGEAARKVSEETRRELPGVAWPEVVGMRNRLIHAYSSIDYEIVWRTAQESVPQLIGHLKAWVDAQ